MILNRSIILLNYDLLLHEIIQLIINYGRHPYPLHSIRQRCIQYANILLLLILLLIHHILHSLLYLIMWCLKMTAARVWWHSAAIRLGRSWILGIAFPTPLSVHIVIHKEIMISRVFIGSAETSVIVMVAMCVSEGKCRET